MTQELVEAYEILGELTRPLCDACPNATGTRCCYPEACAIAKMMALGWGEDLGEPNPTYLTPTGCSVAPHLRPHCTGYLCPEALAQASPEVQEEYRAIRAYIARLGGEHWPGPA